MPRLLLTMEEQNMYNEVRTVHTHIDRLKECFALNG